MSKKAALYGRVSTKNQDLSEQEEKLTEWAEDNNYDYDLLTEEVSSVKERPKFIRMMDTLDQYDIVAVTHLDRFGRSTRDILAQIDRMKDEGVEFVTIDQMFDLRKDSEMGEAMTELMLQVFSAFGEFERKMKRKRMEEGYEEALDDGRVGRPKALNDKEEEYVVDKYERGHSISSIRRLILDKFGTEVSRSPVERVVDERGLRNS